MARQSTKSKFIFVKCLSSLTYEEAITYLTILISSHKKMVKKKEEKSIHQRSFYFADLYIKKFKYCPLKIFM